MTGTAPRGRDPRGARRAHRMDAGTSRRGRRGASTDHVSRVDLAGADFPLVVLTKASLENAEVARVLLTDAGASVELEDAWVMRATPRPVALAPRLPVLRLGEGSAPHARRSRRDDHEVHDMRAYVPRHGRPNALEGRVGRRGREFPDPTNGYRRGMRERPASVTAYRSGPFLVRGPVTLVGEDGDELFVRRDVVALCRCGSSRTQPLCDGSHAARSRGGSRPSAA